MTSKTNSPHFGKNAYTKIWYLEWFDYNCFQTLSKKFFRRKYAYFTAIENIDVFNVHSDRKMLIGLAKVSEIV